MYKAGCLDYGDCRGRIRVRWQLQEVAAIRTPGRPMRALDLPEG